MGIHFLSETLAGLRILQIAALFLSALLIQACGIQGPGTAARSTQIVSKAPDTNPEVLSWRDLIPDAELELLDQLNSGVNDQSLMSQFVGASPVAGQVGTFNTVSDLHALHIRMPGYILPLDYSERGSATEFLLLPYHGACIHLPAPPPNQVVYLTSEKPIFYNGLWEPIWAEGVLTIDRFDTELAASAYRMRAISISPYHP